MGFLVANSMVKTLNKKAKKNTGIIKTENYILKRAIG